MIWLDSAFPAVPWAIYLDGATQHQYGENKTCMSVVLVYTENYISLE